MTADVCVVGAGVVGAGVAWELSRVGHRVVVVEAAAVAAGASGGWGKRGVRANGRDARELPLMRRANELWPELAGRIKRDTGYVRCGHLLVSERPDGFAELEALVDRQTRTGIDSELLTGAGLSEREPDLASGVVAAVWCPDDGMADHTATTAGLMEEARQQGAELRIGSPVVAVRSGPTGPEAVMGDGEVIAAGAMIVATNATASDLLRPLGVNLPTAVVHPQVVLLRPPGPSPIGHLIGHRERPLNLKTLPDGLVMLTGGRLGRRGSDRRVIAHPAEVTANISDAIAVYPALVGAELLGATADRAESVSADMVPIIDRVAAVDRCWFATGWSGHGWAIAPAVAELLAEWVTTGIRPALLVPFAADR